MLRNRFLVLILEVFVRTVTTEYCLASSLGEQQEASVLASFYYNTPHHVSAQCKPVDLTTVLPFAPQFGQRTFWIDKGDYCSGSTCPALVRNISDMIASTSIHCIDCSEQHEMMFDHYGGCEGSDETVSLTAGSHEGSCKSDWVKHDNTNFLISPVRRTMLGSHDWCMSLRNGTTLDNLTELNYIEHVTFPPPVMKYYWISVTVRELNLAAGFGLVLTSNKTEGQPLTSTYNIVQESNLNCMYGSLCIRKDTIPTTSSVTVSKLITKQTKPATASTPTTTPVTSMKTTSKSAQASLTTQPTTKVKSRKYQNKRQINGHLKTSSGMAEFVVKRSVECAIQCDQLTRCRSYFYDKVTSVCQLNTGLYHSVSTLVPVATAKYYEKMHH